MQILWIIKASGCFLALKVCLKENTKITWKSIKVTVEAQSQVRLAQDISTTLALSLPVTQIPPNEIVPLWESEGKVTLSPTSRAASPTHSTLWKMRQPERMQCPLYNKAPLRIQAPLIPGQSKSSQWRRESVCRLCCSGIVRIRYRGSSKR